MRDYQIISPSLEGVLNHSSLLYEGISRPLDLLRVLDGPASKGTDQNNPTRLDKKMNDEEQKVLSQYFQDLYGIFMKKLSFFVVEAYSNSDEIVKLQAMLQEMIKIKRLIGEKS
jgi:hypothetical protein